MYEISFCIDPLLLTYCRLTVDKKHNLACLAFKVSFCSLFQLPVVVNFQIFSGRTITLQLLNCEISSEIGQANQLLRPFKVAQQTQNWHDCVPP